MLHVFLTILVSIFMTTNTNAQQIFTKTLDNGLTILVRPTHNVPEVELALWYDVGSKDEKDGERGMAHLIEHMIFKGTKQLSESDINMITHKLSGYTNAFTSYDFTTFVFRFPSNSWHHGLWMLADCMEGCTFDEEMLNSEVKVVVQELKMYKDDYQDQIMSTLMASIFAEHPYHHPIIGYKQDLLSLSRDTLYDFYKKHYHTANATLVIVGDVDPDEAIAKAEEQFGAIAPRGKKLERPFFFNEDIGQQSATIYREVEQPWACFAYKIPGLREQKGHLYYLISVLLGGGKSSVLHAKLVDELQIANAVGVGSYDLIEKDLMLISVSPKDDTVLEQIKQVINDEISRIARDGIADWEFKRMQKRAELDYLTLLENNEQQSTALGSFFIATGEADYLEKYLEKIAQATSQDVQAEIARTLRPTVQHSGYVLPLPEDEKAKSKALQEASDALDAKILAAKKRSTAVEDGKYAHQITPPAPVDFAYPKPTELTLDNGMQVLYYHNAHVPKVSMLVGLKANYLYDEKGKEGISHVHSKLLLEGTTKRDATELHKYLESNGIYLRTNSGFIGLECLRDDLGDALDVTLEVLTQPAFNEGELAKIKEQTLVDIKEYWDAPGQCIDQVARDFMYGEHPYSKLVLGTEESLASLTREDIVAHHEQYMTPKEAILVLVGDLDGHDSPEKLKAFLQQHLGGWQGPEVADLTMPKISYEPGQEVWHNMNRDQVVIGLIGPSVERTHEDYDKLALLDVVLTGGPNRSMSSRLFALREQTGLFYTIGGSLTHFTQEEPGVVFLKTIVSPDQVETAENLILGVLEKVKNEGITPEEFSEAKRTLINAAIGHFESNAEMARVFYFLKKFGFKYDLFDKRGAELSILDIESIREVAVRYCDPAKLSVVRVGPNG